MTDNTQKQVAETVVRLHYSTLGMFKTPLGGYVRFSDYEALAARLAEVEAENRTLFECLDANWTSHQQMIAARQRAEAAEARATELEALLAAYQDQTTTKETKDG